MSPFTPNSSFEDVLAEIMDREEAGNVIDWAREIAAHPAYAARLARQAENVEWAKGVFAPARPPAIGDRVGRYELTRFIADGYEGEVFAAHDLDGLRLSLRGRGACRTRGTAGRTRRGRDPR